MFWTFKLKGFDNPSLPYETKDEGRSPKNINLNVFCLNYNTVRLSRAYMANPISITKEQASHFKANILALQEILDINDLVLGRPLSDDITPYLRQNFRQKSQIGRRLLSTAEAIGPRLSEGGQLTASEYFLFQKIQSGRFQKIWIQNRLLKRFPLQLTSNEQGLSALDYVVRFIQFMTQFETYLNQ